MLHALEGVRQRCYTRDKAASERVPAQLSTPNARTACIWPPAAHQAEACCLDGRPPPIYSSGHPPRLGRSHLSLSHSHTSHTPQHETQLVSWMCSVERPGRSRESSPEIEEKPVVRRVLSTLGSARPPPRLAAVLGWGSSALSHCCRRRKEMDLPRLLLLSVVRRMPRVVLFSQAAAAPASPASPASRGCWAESLNRSAAPALERFQPPDLAVRVWEEGMRRSSGAGLSALKKNPGLLMRLLARRSLPNLLFQLLARRGARRVTDPRRIISRAFGLSVSKSSPSVSFGFVRKLRPRRSKDPPSPQRSLTSCCSRSLATAVM